MRFGGATNVALHFVPAGETLDGQVVDSDSAIIHVDTGGGRYDHHQRYSLDECAAELVRRAIAPENQVLAQLVNQVLLIDTASASATEQAFTVTSLIAGFNLLFPNSPSQVASAMLPNLDAWYEHESRLLRLADSFAARIEFDTPWGLGVAVESADGASSRMAYGLGAVLYVYRDGNGWMGVVARSRSHVDLAELYAEVRRLDGDADWYLHPNRRLLLCGTAKAPARTPSRLSLDELVQIIAGEVPAFS